MRKDFQQIVIPALENAVSKAGVLLRDVDLSSLSRWKIGGRAAVLVEPGSSAEAMAVMRIMAERPEPLFIMGDASNVLFDSSGFDGVIMRMGRRMSRVEITERSVWAEAGIWVPQLARRVGCAGLSGMEHTVGIPGTLGGLILMNGGSQRKGIGLNVRKVLCADRMGNQFELSQAECGFAYRTTSLQGSRSVILEAELEFIPSDKAVVRREMIEIMKDRRRKFPKNLPNCGSTFLSDPAMYSRVGPPGKAIEQVGLKGLRRGGAQISPLHANFIVNNGGASSEDVLWLIGLIRYRVHKLTGWHMACEVRYVSKFGMARSAHEVSDELFGESYFINSDF